MAYDSPFRRHEADRQDTTSTIGLGEQPQFRGQPGFRDEPDYRSGYQAAGYQAAGHQAGYQAGGYRYGGSADPVAVTGDADLDPREPADEELDRDRDRLAVHWIWEAVLLAGVAALAVLLWQAEPGALRGNQLGLLLVLGTGFGLLGLAAGVTLRAAVPNLAIGPVAVAAGVHFAQAGDVGVVPALTTALTWAVALGVAVAVLVAGFHVPAWAASLAAGAAAVVWLLQQPTTIELAGTYSPNNQAPFLIALVGALAVLGGLLGTLRGVRAAAGRFRPEGDPARRRGPLAAGLAGGAIVLSMALAAVAGVLLVAGYGDAIAPGAPVEGRSGVTWLAWTAVGFAVALIGGTSAFGRRGGVFGTLLAVLALVLFERYQAAQGWDIALLATAAAGVAAGLVVTRLVEAFGRPRAGMGAEPPADGGQWETGLPARTAAPAGGRHADSEAATAGWPSSATPAGSAADAWSSALPARPAPGVPAPWDDDRWRR